MKHLAIQHLILSFIVARGLRYIPRDPLFLHNLHSPRMASFTLGFRLPLLRSTPLPPAHRLAPLYLAYAAVEPCSFRDSCTAPRSNRLLHRIT
ncbi:hypothetical protein GGR52DRAFT_165213 [Hypoxylon sp. FL1284]|nr:hypothetical protein GGR52DRAFT_165213 [Hypoxylon sp. FL1284]